jgi:phosphoglycolate phosphatase
MGVVTNKPEELAWLLLAQLNIAPFFKAVVGGDTLVVCKPDPAPLYYARRLIAPCALAVMIGDSDVDAAAAAAASMPFLLFTGGYGVTRDRSVSADLRFSRYEQLPEAMRTIWPLANKGLKREVKNTPLIEM